MSGYTTIKNLSEIACGINIEGCRPQNFLPDNCKWFNIIQVIDTPLTGNTFDFIMEEMYYLNCKTIEEAAGIEVKSFINDIVTLVNNIKKDYSKLLIHVHQDKNTTCLHYILSKILNMTILVDDGNFFCNPIDYGKLYPDTDAILSISQCAGLGKKTGCYIIPSGFMEFDVDNNIIFTDKKYMDMEIEKYISFDYAIGSILYVTKIWNPININEDILLIDNQDKMVLDFVKCNTLMFDESHDWHHAISVAKIATRILNNKQVLYLSLLHDVCDHKYSESISREKLSIWINENLQEYIDIDNMIDEISFSKQIKSIKNKEECSPARMYIPLQSNENDQIIQIVRDADRLEAIGEIGLYRCEQYTKKINGKIPDDVIVHCYEKLLRLIPDKFIVSDKIMKEAIKRHNVIVKYVRENLPKTTLNYDLPSYL